jgi:hypothetical protein
MKINPVIQIFKLNPKYIFQLLVIISIICLTQVNIFSDQIYLKSGQIINGKITSEEEKNP